MRCRNTLTVAACLFALVAISTAPLEAGQQRFKRGDSNGDGNGDLSDGIFSLNHLFIGGTAPGCLDAADANDSGGFDLSDAVFTFNFLFLGGAPPPEPGPRTCGPDPTEDRLSCDRYDACRAEECDSNADCSRSEFCQQDECGGRGVCETRPEGCPEIFDPVCGCDGNTYSNECFASRAGVNVASEGECEIDECRENADCPRATYCAKADGDCDSTGSCQDLPQGCPRIFDPVCGCDDNTYGNACEAAAAGVSVAQRGECESPTGCRGDEDCPGDTYCARSVGDCDDEGSCRPVPDACPDIFDPVCGCDGNTYSNACYASQAGVSIETRGACDPLPGGCRSSEDCGDDDYCRRADGCEGAGVCSPRPDACVRIYDPVCGCDGNTYSNACVAAASGVSVSTRGECAPNVCVRNDDCDDSDYCAKPNGECESNGECRDRPDACIQVFDPVCGCDGETYGNACVAAAQGVSVSSRGACDVPSECSENADCSAEEFCFRGEGDCQGRGACRPRPDLCPDVWDPVCGCDGQTYSNACDAAAAGATIESRGACQDIDECRSNGDCERGEYCAADECGGGGVCRSVPFACPDVWDPVCGCDGNTYSNRCYAARSGVSVEHHGVCAPSACDENSDCADSEFCSRVDAACGGEGVCRPRPDICVDIWDPVCGCDDETYGNACEAAAAGVGVTHRGVCEDIDECRANGDCEDGEYCAKSGDCDGAGECRDRPDACPRIYDPVCACDGNTYANRCFAAAAGASVEHHGACEPTACRENSDCPEGDYCATHQGECDDVGSCREQPDACPRNYDPVCGCNGLTYGNACEAASEGVSIEHRGACRPDGCRDNDDCADGEFCSKPSGECDGIGSCQSEDVVCVAINLVCGCDGNTYQNYCDAAGSGVSIAHQGECESDCRSNEDCPRGDYCARAQGDCDGAGSCRDRPNACPRIYAPVCGCDGNTYGNACVAASVGVVVEHDGACRPERCDDPEDCDDDEFCQRPNGDCDGVGVCRPSGGACPLYFDPVCGCDGETYSNACFAALAGVTVESDGACDDNRECRSNGDCIRGEYCLRDGCDGDGVCRDRPDICTREYAPVCGCDGQTYGNRCEAARAGMTVEHAGECEPDNMCDGDEDCDDGEVCWVGGQPCDEPGVCRPPIGILCLDVVDPVCGCDGNTYLNSCVATAANVGIAHGGPCVVDDCRTDQDCAANEYCSQEACDGPGVCQDRPEVCVRVYDPVCGCDGETYSNSCFAASAGVSVAHSGVCQPDVGCGDDSDCDRGEYCAMRLGACEGVGECTEIPEICIAIYDPVCGCDGRTYGNACRAASAGVNVVYRGECRDRPCRANGDCGEDQFCERGDGNCDDGLGECVDRPTICPRIFAPVCGCDGKSYGNSCEARAAGVNIVHEGACEDPGDCRSNRDCPQDEYCASNDCGGAGDCRPRPQGCPEIFDPVCGCDGQTYSNSCEAASAGANVLHEGECRSDACGPNRPCDRDQFCQRETGDCEGEGSCVDPPQGCPDVFDPVCGCDGRTYGNECEAAAAGVSVAAKEACRESCRSNEECDARSFCRRDPSDCEGSGECSPRPLNCPAIFDPVCGCDGETYGNECEAASQGVSVSARGACEASCEKDSECAEDQFCQKPSGECEGRGSCETPPIICTRELDPVCGCDGNTYSNPCQAAAASVSVSYRGECRETCSDDRECVEAGAAPAFCQRADGDCQGEGRCAEVPDACPDVFDPVCGCDGETYGNDCEAAAKGVSVASRGACERQ